MAAFGRRVLVMFVLPTTLLACAALLLGAALSGPAPQEIADRAAPPVFTAYAEEATDDAEGELHLAKAEDTMAHPAALDDQAADTAPKAAPPASTDDPALPTETASLAAYLVAETALDDTDLTIDTCFNSLQIAPLYPHQLAAPATCASDPSAALAKADKSQADYSPEGCGGETHGTALTWAGSPADAARLAAQQDKLVYAIHVSGNFAMPGYT